ncbi:MULTISPECIES: hypothetical protein [unclassified Microcoleus]|uniref:hypothetical protein n=1 Tax=unclassified Microcoleus TaxID=2642155 RepID=UPI002FCFE55B
MLKQTGDRKSWDSTAKNSSLIRLAASASARGRRSRSQSYSFSCYACLRFVRGWGWCLRESG